MVADWTWECPHCSSVWHSSEVHRNYSKWDWEIPGCPRCTFGDESENESENEIEGE